MQGVVGWCVSLQGSQARWRDLSVLIRGSISRWGERREKVGSKAAIKIERLIRLVRFGGSMTHQALT